MSKQLLAGEIVAVPTETVYGLAAYAFDAAACARIFAAKQRPKFDPLIVHLPAGYSLNRIAEATSAVAPLGEAFWPGPLTLVLRKKVLIPDIVTAGRDSVAVRIPKHPVFQQLLHACEGPLAAPSANPFGYVSPTTAQHVQESLGDRIPSILDGGPCEHGIESTIVDVRDPDKPILLRPGAIPREAIETALGRTVKAATETDGTSEAVMPGQLSKHYSPRSVCELRDSLSLAEVEQDPSAAYVFYRKPATSRSLPKNAFWLTEDGDDIQAAQSLFGILREVDRRGYATLIAERAPGDSGLAPAINDRLQRAAAN